MKNGLLTVELSEEEVQAIFDAIAAEPGLTATVDLEAQRVTLNNVSKTVFAFEIDATAKQLLINGLDEISLTLACSDAITAFETTHNPQI